MKSSLKHKLYIPVRKCSLPKHQGYRPGNKQLQTQEEQFKWKEKIVLNTHHFFIFLKTGDVSGRTKFGECILLPCDMSASLISHSALCSLRGLPTFVLSLQQEMGKHRAVPMAQVLTRTWPLANENLETGLRTSTPFSGDKNALALSFPSWPVKWKSWNRWLLRSFLAWKFYYVRSRESWGWNKGWKLLVCSLDRKPETDISMMMSQILTNWIIFLQTSHIHNIVTALLSILYEQTWELRCKDLCGP